MPGLVPGIHVLRTAAQGVDGRDNPAMTRRGACASDEGIEFGHENSGKSWGTAPDPLNPGAIRATLRDPDGFGHIGWMIRSVGVFGAVACILPPGFSNALVFSGIGRVVQ